jgi:hypothetical protein
MRTWMIRQGLDKTKMNYKLEITNYKSMWFS